QVVGRERVDDDVAPVMGAEDFSFMLEARPGAFIFVGNGDSAGLHHPAYDFNDEAIPFGASHWIKLIDTALPGCFCYVVAPERPQRTTGRSSARPGDRHLQEKAGRPRHSTVSALGLTD